MFRTCSSPEANARTPIYRICVIQYTPRHAREQHITHQQPPSSVFHQNIIYKPTTAPLEQRRDACNNDKEAFPLLGLHALVYLSRSAKNIYKWHALELEPFSARRHRPPSPPLNIPPLHIGHLATHSTEFMPCLWHTILTLASPSKASSVVMVLGDARRLSISGPLALGDTRGRWKNAKNGMTSRTRARNAHRK